MKYIKRLALDRSDQQSNRFAVEADNRIVTTSKVSLQLPSGATSDRPSPVDGQVRYNTTLHDSEIYNASGEGNGWEKIKTNRQTTITPQNLGVGNYLNTWFGPLSYPIDSTKPQNVLVFIGSAFQIPNTNYTLSLGTSVHTTKHANGQQSGGLTSIMVDSVANVLVGEIVTSTTGLAVGTVVTGVNTSTNSVSINPATLGSTSSAAIADGQAIYFSANTGTDVYINFTSAAPADQVFALLGYDGYSP